MLPPSIANPLPPPKQLSTIQAPSHDIEVSVGADKGKEVQPPIKANRFEDALTIKDMVSKAKDIESKSKARIPNLRQLIPRKTLTKQRQDLSIYIYIYIYSVILVFHHFLQYTLLLINENTLPFVS